MDKPLLIAAVVGGAAALLFSRKAVAAPGAVTIEQYPPHSSRAVVLFERAARAAGLPVAWAREPGLHEILEEESGGWVGRPNYTYNAVYGRDPHFNSPQRKSEWPVVWRDIQNGRYRTSSTATGLGQLVRSNVEAFYPDGRAGIGDPLNEAVGMLKYIERRYGNPADAWAFYQLPRCPSGTRSYYSRRGLEIGCKPGEGY